MEMPRLVGRPRTWGGTVLLDIKVLETEERLALYRVGCMLVIAVQPQSWENMSVNEEEKLAMLKNTQTQGKQLAQTQHMTNKSEQAWNGGLFVSLELS